MAAVMRATAARMGAAAAGARVQTAAAAASRQRRPGRSQWPSAGARQGPIATGASVEGASHLLLALPLLRVPFFARSSRLRDMASPLTPPALAGR